MTQLLFTEVEAAERLRLCTRTLRKARAAGLLRYVLIGRAVRYTAADLESYVEALRCQPAPAPAQPPRRAGSKSAKVIPFTVLVARR